MKQQVPLPLILGSQSPARKEILEFFSIPFIQKAANIDEESFPFNGNPQEHAKFLAEEKGAALHKIFPKDLILTADTLVFCENKLYNKPQNRQEAFDMLTFLSGKWHQIFTAISLRYKDIMTSEVETTAVLMHDLKPYQIELYHSRIDFKNKAGGYTIQGAGNLIINRIDGSFYNVVGLPINALRKILLKVEIDLWDFFKK